jgi:hypothetical protein
VTEPANAAAVLVPAELGDAELAADDAALDAAALEVAAGADDELELDPELQAAAPASRQAPTAMNRQLDPAVIRVRIPVERDMAPSRLSVVNANSPFA